MKYDGRNTEYIQIEQLGWYRCRCPNEQGCVLDRTCAGSIPSSPVPWPHLHLHPGAPSTKSGAHCPSLPLLSSLFSRTLARPVLRCSCERESTSLFPPSRHVRFLPSHSRPSPPLRRDRTRQPDKFPWATSFLFRFSRAPLAHVWSSKRGLTFLRRRADFYD